MIPNALQPASIEEVFLYVRLGRAVVLVKEDQLSLAIGRRGQNVRLASKLVGWDIEIMTMDELNEGIERAEGWFKQIPGVADEMVEAFIEEGFLSYDDLTFMEPSELAELAGVTEDQAQDIIDFAEESAERVEEETRIARETAAEEGRTLAARGITVPTEVPKQSEARTTFDNLFAPEPSPEAAPAEAVSGEAEAVAPDQVAEAAPPTEVVERPRNEFD